MPYLATFAVALMLLDCSGASPSGDPDGGGAASPDACAEPALEYRECSTGEAGYSVTAGPIAIGGEPTDGAVDAVWSPAESHYVRLGFDGAAPRAIEVPIDPTPLNAVLAAGDPVRMTRTSVSSAGGEELLRIARPDGSLLLEVTANTTYFTDPELPSIEGFGAALTATPVCEEAEIYSQFCGPAIHRVSALDVAVGDETVRIAPGETREIPDGDATYAVTNLRLSWATPGRAGCLSCAPAFPTVAQIGVVRAR